MCGFKLASSGTIYQTPTHFTSRLFDYIDLTTSSAAGIDPSDQLWAWGINADGRLGDRTIVHRSDPVPTLSNVVGVAMGSEFGVAVDTSGVVRTWGLNRDYSLAREAGFTASTFPRPIQNLIHNSNIRFSSHNRGTLAYEAMSLGVSPRLIGNVTFTLDHSELLLSLVTMSVSNIFLFNSYLYAFDVLFLNLDLMNLTQSMVVLGGKTTLEADIQISLIDSELFLNENVTFQYFSIDLIALESIISVSAEYLQFNALYLFHSTLSSMSNVDLLFNSFDCFPQPTFSSTMFVTESVSTALLTGNIRTSNSIHLLCNVTLVDLDLSELPSTSLSELPFTSSPSLTFYSSVWLCNRISVLINVEFQRHVFLSNASYYSDRDLKIDFLLSGTGDIYTNVLNSGGLIPKLLEIDAHLTFFAVSKLQVSLSSGIIPLSVVSTASLSGALEVEIDVDNDTLIHDIIGREFTLVRAGEIIGNFDDIDSDCNSILSISYTASFVIASVNDYIVNLNQVSYISTTGFDDPCCGTFNSPCASFKGVLERMGRKGKVYFHGGSYSFNQGLGKVSNVDWEVIGLGDVNIEGMSETLFEIDESVFVLSNVFVNTSTSRTFHISNSSVSVNNSTFQSLNMFSDGVVFDSSFTVCSSIFISFSFEIVRSDAEFSNSTFAGEVSGFLFQFFHHL
ncbi:hypothetical protein GEMRC1_008554 [Eukaryota sp. GEM-RC1]